MTIRAQTDYRNWRCPECQEVVSTLARRSTLPCPRCGGEMALQDRSEDVMARASTTTNGHRASGGEQ